ncbi:MAG TPA: cytochrome c family protein [Hyphomicrobiaceae bacterium]|nr:cytochrome c family protein [Hyphomicrobiaceae bacterium]
MKPLVSIVAGLMFLSAPYATATAQDAQSGEQIYRQCRACHQIGEGARNLVGPQLNGIVGRRAGTVEGFTYSQANKEAGANGLVWTEDNLFKYLENPMAFMPGTKMVFAGVRSEDARRDLIAYLKKFSSH